MSIVLKNNASDFLAAAIDSSQTSITLESGASFPTLGAGEYFYGTIESTEGTREIVRVNARVGNTLTVVRGQDGTAAASFAQGSRFESRINVASVEDYVDQYVDENAELAQYNQGAGTAVVRTIQNKLQDAVSVKDFGAVGDGVTDDYAAIQAANDSGAEAIYFPSGQYSTSNTLLMTTSWVMEDNAFIVFNIPGVGNTCVACTGSNLYGNVNISGNDGDPRLLFSITGSNNTFSSIVCKDMQATPFTTGTAFRAAIAVTGSGNYIHSVHAKDCVNAGNANESMPNGINLSGASCTRNTFNDVLLENVEAGITITATGGTTNTVNNYVARSLGDNGLYHLAEGRLNIGNMEYNGSEEAVVFTNGGDANIGTLLVTGGTASLIGLQNSGDITIGSLIVTGGFITTLLRTRAANTSSKGIKINSVSGVFLGNTLILAEVGTVDYISISNLNVDFLYDQSIIGITTRFASMTAAKSINIENWFLRIIDVNDEYDNRIFELRTPDPSTASGFSYIRNVKVRGLESDGITPKSFIFRIVGINSNLVSYSDLNIQTNVGPYGTPTSHLQSYSLTASSPPNGGTWRRGDIFWNNGPSAGGNVGWVCVDAGSPGTWKAFGVIDA